MQVHWQKRPSLSAPSSPVSLGVICWDRPLGMPCLGSIRLRRKRTRVGSGEWRLAFSWKPKQADSFTLTRADSLEHFARGMPR